MAEFPTVPAMMFPVYDVLAAIAPPREWQRCAAQTAPSGHVEALTLTRDGVTRVLLANITGSEQRVVVDGLTGRDAIVERVDADDVAAALTDPRVGRDEMPPSRVTGQLSLVLTPYEIAVITTGVSS